MCWRVIFPMNADKPLPQHLGGNHPELTDPTAQTALSLLEDIDRFSRAIIGMPLRGYQSAPLRAIIDSVLNRKGLEFLLVFPRQSGKNEAIAHLLVYLLTVLQRRGGQIVYGAVGDSLGRGMQRLEERLETPWTRGRWRRGGHRVVTGWARPRSSF
jgi:hypothetical protein